MTESTADIIARLQARLRPHAASPVTARRKETDSTPPSGASDRYPPAGTLSSRRRGGKYPNTYKPRVKDFAGMAMVTPPTTQPNAPSVKPANGIRVAGYTNRADAGVIGTDNGYRQWSAARGNLQRDAGEMPGTGESYPRKITRHGNLGPSARY